MDAFPGTANCAAFSRTRVTIDASQVTVVELVQYAAVIGIVNTWFAALVRLVTFPNGSMKLIVVVFSRFFAFRKISAATPPAATCVGKILLNVTAFVVVTFTSVIVESAK